MKKKCCYVNLVFLIKPRRSISDYANCTANANAKHETFQDVFNLKYSVYFRIFQQI